MTTQPSAEEINWFFEIVDADFLCDIEADDLTKFNRVKDWLKSLAEESE